MQTEWPQTTEWTQSQAIDERKRHTNSRVLLADDAECDAHGTSGNGRQTVELEWVRRAFDVCYVLRRSCSEIDWLAFAGFTMANSITKTQFESYKQMLLVERARRAGAFDAFEATTRARLSWSPICEHENWEIWIFHFVLNNLEIMRFFRNNKCFKLIYFHSIARLFCSIRLRKYPTVEWVKVQCGAATQATMFKLIE